MSGTFDSTQRLALVLTSLRDAPWQPEAVPIGTCGAGVRVRASSLRPRVVVSNGLRPVVHDIMRLTRAMT